MSEERRIRRHLLTRSKKGRLKTGEKEQFYVDNIGLEYPYKWEAKLSSFYNVFMGCMRNGFPVVVPKLWYSAWAFYPFFFVRKNLPTEGAIPTLNHERIHVRQQWDIHVTISFPIIILLMVLELFGDFNPLPYLCGVPFIPTLLYGFDMVRSWRNLVLNGIEHVTFHKVRENTCFEREAISRSTNTEYLHQRKFWAVLAYTGWKSFQNYGMDK